MRVKFAQIRLSLSEAKGWDKGHSQASQSSSQVRGRHPGKGPSFYGSPREVNNLVLRNFRTGRNVPPHSSRGLREWMSVTGVLKTACVLSKSRAVYILVNDKLLPGPKQSVPWKVILARPSLGRLPQDLEFPP